MKSFAFLVVAVLLGLGCEKKTTPAPPTAASTHSPSVASAASAPSAAAAQTKNDLVGSFMGKYSAKAFQIEVENSGVREWKKNEGKAGVGDGNLKLQVADDGVVSGSVDGALGTLLANGKLDGSTLKADLRPSEGDGFRGLLVAEKQGSGFHGNIRASTGDSLNVRVASFELQKSP
jgi:hypothetical protein